MKRVNLDVLRMAREAGMQDCTCNGTLGCLERFAELVRLDEREVCAYKAGIAVLGADRGLANRVDQAIRARGSNT